jgi:predicted NBD/HSP70 family sugar kinase
VVREHEVPLTPGAPPNEIVEALALSVLALEAEPTGVGLAVPGRVDGSGCCWRLPHVPGFEGVYIADELAERLGCPVAIETDATAGARGELLHGLGRHYPSFVWISLHTGIQAGLVLGGTAYRGSCGLAGELGHIRVDATRNAEPCVCGLEGCLEVYASAPAIIRRFIRLGGRGESLPSVSESARRGEPAGAQTMALAGAALGRALGIVQNMLDLDAAFISSPESDQLALLEPHVREALALLTFGKSAAELPVLEAALGPKSVLVGASSLVHQSVDLEPASPPTVLER